MELYFARYNNNNPLVRYYTNLWTFFSFLALSTANLALISNFLSSAEMAAGGAIGWRCRRYQEKEEVENAMSSSDMSRNLSSTCDERSERK